MLIKSEFFDIEYEIEPEDKLTIDILMQVEEMRLRRGWTQAELAQRIGTTQSSIARLEAGFSLPSLKMLVRLAAAFETTLIEPKFAELLEAKPSRQKQMKTENKIAVNSVGRRKPRVTKKFRQEHAEIIYADSKSGSTASVE